MYQDDDNIYVLEEENPQEVDLDDSPLNFAAYNDEERKEAEKEETETQKGRGAFSLLLKIMFNPVEGWKTLRRSKTGIEKLQSGCFYPLLAFVAISKFAEFFYSVNIGLSTVVTKAVVAFVSFFFGYFCIPMVISWFVSKDAAEKINDKFGKEYILISLSTLALFSIVIDLLPMIWPILIFLPLWTIYIMYKGVRFFNVATNEEMKLFVLSSAACIAIPLLIDRGLNLAIPY